MNQEFISDCQRAVQIPSESGHEEAVASFIKSVMEKLEYDKVWIDEVGNVLGLIKGNGPATIMLEGHMDTVGIGSRCPVFRQNDKKTESQSHLRDKAGRC